MSCEARARHGHIAATIGEKFYLWGGRTLNTDDLSHDGPDKRAINSVIDILDVKVCMVNVPPVQSFLSTILHDIGLII